MKFCKYCCKRIGMSIQHRMCLFTLWFSIIWFVFLVVAYFKLSGTSFQQQGSLFGVTRYASLNMAFRKYDLSRFLIPPVQNITVVPHTSPTLKVIASVTVIIKSMGK